MNGKTHLTVGVLTGIGVAALENKIGFESTTTIAPILLIIGSGIGSLLPDIDIKTSMMGRHVPLWLFFEHRTVTHSFLFIGIVSLIATLCHAPFSLSLGFCIGILTHLFLDSLTPRGLPYLLFPIVKKHYRKY